MNYFLFKLVIAFVPFFQGRVKASVEPPVFFEEVLVTRSDLEEKTAITEELRTRVEELKMENEYQLRLKVIFSL